MSPEGAAVTDDLWSEEIKLINGAPVWSKEGDSTTPKMVTGRAKSNQTQNLFANPDSERALLLVLEWINKQQKTHTSSIKMILQNIILMTWREKKHAFKNVY